ncbi:MAG: MOSC domain-containing protein [Flavobacteriales bacterium]|nr:MOSC domain-containing protein [Flavobacteriales bacterium]
MDRFRPNIVIAGGHAFQEDGWKGIATSGARFSLVKPCARCVIPTIDQHTGERGKEPSRTLATYRKRVMGDGKVKVDFGINAMAPEGGIVRPANLLPFADPCNGSWLCRLDYFVRRWSNPS